MKKFIEFKRFFLFKKNRRKEFDLFKNSKSNHRGFLLSNDFYHIDKYREFSLDYHYFYHPIWAFNLISKRRPKQHIDISSINYFAGFLSTVIPTTFMEFRIPNIKLSNLEVKKGDLLNLPWEDNSIFSISCMHTLEHVGLGRYGDQIDYDGDLFAARELSRVSMPGGYLYLVVPIGKPKISFNSHRIYSFEMVLEMFSKFCLLDFSVVWDNGVFEENADPNKVQFQNYACGCFCFQKK
jgi:hypothetical protein